MKHTTTLVLSEKLPEPGMRLLHARPDVRLQVLHSPVQSELEAALPEAEGVVLVMEQPVLTAEVIEAAKNLRVACRCGAGYDNFDLPALTRRGIPLATTGSANADTVAEHALYLMLALARRGPVLDRSVKAGAWPRAFGGVELAGRTCAVVGYGRIGRAVAKRAAAFDMKIVIVDPAFPETKELGEALSDADFVVLACALTPQTTHLMNADAFKQMKRMAFVVNIARGPVIDEKALIAALEAGRLAGAGLDVLEHEPPHGENPLLGREDVVLTPHVAAYIDTAFERMAIVCAQNALAGLDGTLDRANVVNREVFA